MKRFGHDVQLATELGMSMGVMAAGWTMLGLWLGSRLDATLETQPMATLLLLLSGAAAGQLSIFRLVARARPRLESGERHALSVKDALWAIKTALVILLLLVVPITLGLVLGVWLDGRLGTHLVFTLVLSLGCLGVGLYGAVRIARSRSAQAARAGDHGCSSAKDSRSS